LPASSAEALVFFPQITRIIADSLRRFAKSAGDIDFRAKPGKSISSYIALTKFQAMRTITATDLKARIDSGETLILINALEEPKFRYKHIPGSVNLFDKHEVQARIKKDDAVVVYCTDVACPRSITLYEMMNSLGYTNVTRFAGGLMEWESQGYPLEGEGVLQVG
jgi:rhodanese-related sulfurtransferase